MPTKNDRTLLGRVVALPESRQLDILAVMLEKRDASVIRCPLVTILDAPDSATVLSWIQAFIQTPPDDFIILTGEGIRRLCKVAEAHQLLKAFVLALAKSRKIARGPKPGQALKALGLKADLLAEMPTTDGVITTLEHLDLTDHRIAIQLYGENPNTKLTSYLDKRHISYSTIAPYIYAPDTDDLKVRQLIEQLAANEIDAITFTSQPQYKRLLQVAKKYNVETILANGLAATVVAAVGPVVADALRQHGVRVDLMPESSYFMKPMVSKLIETLAAE